MVHSPDFNTIIASDAKHNDKDIAVKTDESDYDPFSHRDVKNPVSDARSLANLLKASLGSGFLAMPLAFSCAGLITGTIGTIVIGWICTHSVKLLVKLSQNLCSIEKKPLMSYGETCGYTFANGPKCLRKYSKIAKYSLDVSLAITNLSACCVYVVLIANSVEQLLENQYKFDISSIYYCIAFSPVYILIVQINNLKHQAILSAIANVLLLSVSFISFYFIFQELPSIEERELFADISNFPKFLSIVIFAMEGIGCVMAVENKMKQPKHFLGCPGVLNLSMTIVVVMYAFLGLFGYLKYGNAALGSITLNLDINSIWAKIAKVFIIIAILLTYPLQFYVPAEILWTYIEPRVTEGRKRLTQVMFLSTLALISVAVGVAIPKVNVIIELVGAIFFSTLGLLIPAFLDTVYYWDRDLGFMKFKLWKNTLIMLFSLLALSCGVQHSIANM